MGALRPGDSRSSRPRSRRFCLRLSLSRARAARLPLPARRHASICEQFGRELRGADLLSLWEDADRDAVASLLRNVFADGAVGHGRFRAYSGADRQASFEFVLLPLIHTGETINRVLGAITAIEPPFWLGAEPLLRQEIVELNLHWPDGTPAFMAGRRGGHQISAAGASACSRAASASDSASTSCNKDAY